MRKGFTLSELLIAAGILVFALCASLASYITCLWLNHTNRNLTTATTHGQFVLEDIKDYMVGKTLSTTTRTYIENNWDWTTTDVVSNIYNTTNTSLALHNESIATNVTGTDLINVTVTVNWEDRPGRVPLGNVTLLTQIAEP